MALQGHINKPPEQRFLISGKNYWKVVAKRGYVPDPLGIILTPVDGSFVYNDGFPTGKFIVDDRTYEITVPPRGKASAYIYFRINSDLKNDLIYCSSSSGGGAVTVAMYNQMSGYAANDQLSPFVVGPDLIRDAAKKKIPISDTHAALILCILFTIPKCPTSANNLTPTIYHALMSGNPAKRPEKSPPKNIAKFVEP